MGFDESQKAKAGVRMNGDVELGSQLRGAVVLRKAQLVRARVRRGERVSRGALHGDREGGAHRLEALGGEPP